MNILKRAVGVLKSTPKSIGHFILRAVKWTRKHASWSWALAIIVVATIGMNLWDVYHDTDIEEMRMTAFFGWFYSIMAISLLAITSYGYSELRKVFYEMVKDNTSLSIEIIKLQTQLDSERRFHEQEKANSKSGKAGTKH